MSFDRNFTHIMNNFVLQDEESGPCHNVGAQDRYHEQYEIWHQAAKFLEKRDKERIRAWQDEVDGFLNFVSTPRCYCIRISVLTNDFPD